VSPVKYELVFYIPEDDIIYGHRRGNLTSYRLLCSSFAVSVPEGKTHEERVTALVRRDRSYKSVEKCQIFAISFVQYIPLQTPITFHVSGQDEQEAPCFETRATVTGENM
jgi:hypothetical protein